jgi:hypothetical protein
MSEAQELPIVCERYSGNGIPESQWPDRVGEWRKRSKFPPPMDGTGIIGFFGCATMKTQGYVARKDIVPVHWSGWGGGVWESTTNNGRREDRDMTYWRHQLAGPFDDPH